MTDDEAVLIANPDPDWPINVPHHGLPMDRVYAVLNRIPEETP